MSVSLLLLLLCAWQNSSVTHWIFQTAASFFIKKDTYAPSPGRIWLQSYSVHRVFSAMFSLWYYMVKKRKKYQKNIICKEGDSLLSVWTLPDVAEADSGRCKSQLSYLPWGCQRALSSVGSVQLGETRMVGDPGSTSSSCFLAVKKKGGPCLCFSPGFLCERK